MHSPLIWWQALKPHYKTLIKVIGWAMFLIGAGYMVVVIPHQQAAPFKAKIQRERGDLGTHDRLKLEHDARMLENNARTAIIQGLGGAALIIGLIFTWRSIRATERNLQLTQAAATDTLRVAVDGHTTERFTRAIEHLGHEQMVVRLGAIYTLEQIAWPPMSGQAPLSLAVTGNRWPIMEMLMAYVRARAPWPPTASEPETDARPKPREDVQAILTVLGRRSTPYGSSYAYGGMEGQPVQLRRTDLRGADLSGARFEGALLGEAHLEHANLFTAHLEKAELVDAHLEWAYLQRAHLEEAKLSGAHLEEADLSGTHFEGANLFSAHLERQGLFGTHLEGASLAFAHLEGATFQDTHLEGANLRGAYLQGARDLTVEQLTEVKTLYEAHLDPPLRDQVWQQYRHLLEEPRR